MSKLMTLYKILPGCEEGNPEAWKAFLENYTPTAFEIFKVYSPWPPEARLEHWRDALHALSANDCAALKGFSHLSERQFLVGLRAFLLDRAAASLQPSQDAKEPPAPTTETLTTLLAGLPIVHQEITFLTLAGYSLKSIENILRISPTVAEEGLARLQSNFAIEVERVEDRCLWPSAWIAIGKAARAGETKDCPPVRQLVRVLDGQASWYDKSPAELHRSQCLRCLELWTSMLEVVSWERTRQPWPEEKIAPLLAIVPLKQDTRKSSFFARMLGK
jgi:hypothetical protein